MTAYVYFVVCDCTGVSEVRGTIADYRGVLDRDGNPKFVEGRRVVVTPRPFADAIADREPKDIVNNTIRCHRCRKTAQLSAETAAAVCDGFNPTTLLAEMPERPRGAFPEVRRELPLALLCLSLSRITR